VALKLNNYREDFIEYNFSRSIKLMEKFYPEFKKNKHEERLNHRIVTASSIFGYLYYQKEQSADSRKYFKIAAEALSNEFYYVPAPTEGHQTRNPWAFIEAINIISSFGNNEDIARLCDVEESKYHNYPEEQNKKDCQFLADYVSAAKSYLSTGTVDTSSLSNLVDAANLGKRTKEEQHFVVPVVKGLNALVKNDQSNWQAAVQESLDAHLKEVKTGEYRKNYRGFICMPGMMLLKLGQDKGWNADIDSLYLPLTLLEA